MLLYQSPNYYQTKAFGNFYRLMWQNTPYNTPYHIDSLSYYHALSIWIGTTMQNIEDRRILLYSYLANEFNTKDPECTIERYRSILPIDSQIDRVLRNVCTLYNYAPRRYFGTPKQNETMNDMYEEAKVDSIMQDVYRRATLNSLLAVRPVFLNGKLKFYTLQPDVFRIEYDDIDPYTPTQITYSIYEEMEQVITYVTWNKDEVITMDYGGSIIKNEPNRYGRLPFIFLRMSDDLDYYSGGMINIVENQLLINKHKLMSHIDSTFSGFPVKISVNIPPENLKMRPDGIISMQGVAAPSEGGLESPSLSYISPEPQYSLLSEYSEKLEKHMLRSIGIPASSTDEGVSAQSGISRLLERQELIERRTSDISKLGKFERELAELIVLMAKVDMNVNVGELKFGIDYEDERIYTEPDIEYEFDKKKVGDGIMNALDFVKKWGGVEEGISVDEAEKLINERMDIAARLGFKPAPVVVEPAPTDIQTPEMQPINQVDEKKTDTLKKDLEVSDKVSNIA